MENNLKLSHKQFVILGLVSEFPSHAYSIDKRIEDRGMRGWTAIGTSSIYRIIGELEEKGLVSYYEEEVDNRLRKVYTITDIGSEVLKDKVYTVIKNYIGRFDEDFYVAFSMLPLLTMEEQIAAISQSIETVEKHCIELKKMLELNLKQPLNVRGLFIHPIKILETDLEFLEYVLEEVKKGKGQVSPMDYM